MAIDFSVELCGGSEDIHVKTRGLATLDSMRAFTRALMALPEFRLLGERFKDARIAVVVGSVADYGIHRQMELIAGDRYTFKTRPFTDLDEARAWLAQERGQ